MKSVLALWILCASAGTATAEPWTYERFDTGKVVIHSAHQVSNDGDYVLSVECTEPRAWTVYVESPFDWEQGADYAPEVPTRIGVGETIIADVMFRFDERQLGEGIAAYPTSQEPAFSALVFALAGAGKPIELAYFDRAGTFAPDGAHDAISAVLEACR